MTIGHLEWVGLVHFAVYTHCGTDNDHGGPGLASTAGMGSRYLGISSVLGLIVTSSFSLAAFRICQRPELDSDLHDYGPTSIGTIVCRGNPPRWSPCSPFVFHYARRHTLLYTEYQEAFALFDKRGTGRVPKESLGELLRSLGQNPTQREVGELGQRVQGGSFDYNEFLQILNRPDGWRPAGTEDEFIKGFQVFDKTGKGLIGAGELRYVLTQLGEKMSDAEVDELLKGVATVDGQIDYHQFVRSIISQ